MKWGKREKWRTRENLENNGVPPYVQMRMAFDEIQDNKNSFPATNQKAALSGDEWRISATVQLLRKKGVVC